jgi:hypothetical protein
VCRWDIEIIDVFLGYLEFCSGVHCDESEVVWGVDSAIAFEGYSNGCACELASCVVSANELVVMNIAFINEVGT